MKITEKLTTWAALIGVVTAIGGGFYAWGEFNTRLNALHSSSSSFDTTALEARLTELETKMERVRSDIRDNKTDAKDDLNDAYDAISDVEKDIKDQKKDIKDMLKEFEEQIDKRIERAIDNPLSN